MKVKVTEASGPVLDWMVCEAEGWEYDDVANATRDDRNKKYSTNWAQGGPIIEREEIAVATHDEDGWQAYYDKKGMNDDVHTGTTPLIAAMRCYVVSKLGEEVEVPDELV